jgi:thiamine-phosphate pyrophosphorylase
MPRVIRPRRSELPRLRQRTHTEMIPNDDPRLRLVAITDDLRDGVDGLVSRARSAENGGVTMLLLRLKHADAHVLVEVGRALIAALQIPLVVNERLDVALAIGASGVHLNTGSMPVIAIRQHVTAGFLIGGSISDAADLGSTVLADYVTIGPVFGAGATSLGAEGFRRLALASGRPAIAVGGIDAETARSVRAAGAAGVAVIRSVFGSADPAAAATALLAPLEP